MIDVSEPGRVQPLAKWLILNVVGPLVRLLFRPTLEGRENLPDEGPFLLVANHSAGIGLAELVSFASCWLEDSRSEYRLAGFALPIGFKVWPLSAVHRQLGSVPSTYEGGRQALANGASLLVFPGGDHESLKPVWYNEHVDFAGRVGFARLARETGVPMVPMGIQNGALTAPLLFRGQWLSSFFILPRMLGLKRWGISLLGLLVTVLLWVFLPLTWPWKMLAIWLWLGTPLVFMPVIPAPLRFRIGAPLPAGELFSESAGEEELKEAAAQVERAVQALVR